MSSKVFAGLAVDSNTHVVVVVRTHSAGFDIPLVGFGCGQGLGLAYSDILEAVSRHVLGKSSDIHLGRLGHVLARRWLDSDILAGLVGHVPGQQSEVLGILDRESLSILTLR
jgi:hypothetical protein